MFRHVALFRWLEGTTQEEEQAVGDELARLPAVVPELRDYRVGADARLSEGNWDFAVVADFDDAEGWRSYTEHPEHLRILAERIRPMLKDRAAVQYST